jgi:hypothetical protein
METAIAQEKERKGDKGKHTEKERMSKLRYTTSNSRVEQEVRVDV